MSHVWEFVSVCPVVSTRGSYQLQRAVCACVCVCVMGKDARSLLHCHMLLTASLPAELTLSQKALWLLFFFLNPCVKSPDAETMCTHRTTWMLFLLTNWYFQRKSVWWECACLTFFTHRFTAMLRRKRGHIIYHESKQLPHFDSYFHPGATSNHSHELCVLASKDLL